MTDDGRGEPPTLKRFDDERGQLNKALADGGEPGAWVEYGDILIKRTRAERPLYGVFYEGDQVDTIDVRKIGSLAQFHNQLARYEQQLSENGQPEWEPGEMLSFDGAVGDPRGVE